MAKKANSPTRSEMEEKVSGYAGDMRKIETDMENRVEDVDTIRTTLDELDYKGTSEGAEAIQQLIEEAEDVTKEEFDREDEELETLQHENDEYRTELDDRVASSESDRGKLNDAATRIETREAADNIRKAEDAAQNEGKVLNELVSRAREAGERSEQVQNDYQTRVRARR
ncbi:hypothetical protein ACFL1X_01500 [Candidatus Hydrogenedentota bacterium]